MHGKEKLLDQLFYNYLKCELFAFTQFNTDQFGTFSGEIERHGTQEQAALQKIEEAYKLTGENLILASEGSFGAHPQIPFINANIELLVLKDFENNLIWKSWHISTDINAEEIEIKDFNELQIFAEKNFKEGYRIILKIKNDEGKIADAKKGLFIMSEVELGYKDLINKFPQERIMAEVDLRAMYNFKRQNAIKECGLKLVETLISLCPECNCPGFQKTSFIRGLLCELCGMPTNLPLKEVYNCLNCNYSEERTSSENLYAEAQYCNFCNP